jgi:dolichol-phosphate mannosyltransferase
MGTSLIVLPTFEERENLGRLIPRLSALDDLDVLVVDDASPDGTGEVAEALRTRYPRLSVLHRKKKEGLGRAYVHGFGVAFKEGYEAIVTMDADLSHAPEDVPRLLGALEEADVALGSRHAAGGSVVGWPLSRRLLSRAGSLYARTVLRLPASDVTSGFRAYRASALRELDLDGIASRGFIFQVEILRRILDLPGARAAEVPIVFRERAAGHSKLTRGIIIEGVREVARLALRRRRLPARSYEPLRRKPPFEPPVAVVIPQRAGSPPPDALRALEGISYPPEKLEVLVARGSSPSRQRNEAVRQTDAEFILFLDDDSLAAPDLLRKHLEVLERDPTVAAAGGPAESLPRTPTERLFALVLSERSLVGKTASRYAARGQPRFTDERELILCNLLLRRSAFEEAGGFSEALYPNEENEFLERLRLKGWRMVRRPDAVVRRPERRTLREFLGSVRGYGQGRGEQLRILPSRTSLGRSALVALLLLLGAAAILGALNGKGVALLIPAALYALHLALVAARLARRGGLRPGILGAGLGLLLHASYALGLARGLLFPRRERSASEVTLERVELVKPQEPPR